MFGEETQPIHFHHEQPLPDFHDDRPKVPHLPKDLDLKQQDGVKATRNDAHRAKSQG